MIGPGLFLLGCPVGIGVADQKACQAALLNSCSAIFCKCTTMVPQWARRRPLKGRLIFDAGSQVLHLPHEFFIQGSYFSGLLFRLPVCSSARILIRNGW